MAVVRADLDNVFGSENIEKWADLNNNENSSEIDARVVWAVALASSQVEAKLQLSSYDWADISDHLLVEHAIVLKAGLLLYGNREISDGTNQPNPLWAQYQRDYTNFFKDLYAGQLDLGQARGCRPFPAVVDSTYGDIST